MASSSKSLVNYSQQDHVLLFEPGEFRNTTLDSKIRAGMEEMRLTGILCDVTLVAGNVDIQAHKLVLANTSHYFYSMFTEGLKETDSSRIVMEGLDPQTLISLVEYSYTGKIIINQESVINVIIASNMLQIGEVSKACLRFLKKQVQIENCLEFRNFAKVHDQSDLLSYCDSYILEHFGEIVKQEEFLKMNKEDLLVFIASDEMGLDSEEQVFDCILSWIDHDRSLRSGFFLDVMKHVRFDIISLDYLASRIQNEPLLKECDNLKDAISKVIFDRVLKKDSSPSLGSVSKPRQFLNNMMLAVIGGERDSSDRLQSVEAFSFRTNSWSSLCEMPDCRAYCGAAVVGGKVYVMGGKTYYGDCTNSVCMYDRNVDTWSSSIPSMQSERNGLGVAVLDKRIYAIGGFNREEGRLRSAEVLDLTVEGTPEWKYIASMDTPRWGVGVAVLNGRIFAVGGMDHSGDQLSSVETYDPERNVWSSVADLSVPRRGAGVGVLNGTLYCVGGDTRNGSTKTVEKYCEDTNTWSWVAKMNHIRLWPGVFTHEGRLYAVGGYDDSHLVRGGDGDSYLSSMEMYDPVTNTWTLVEDMSVGKSGPAVAVIHRPRTY